MTTEKARISLALDRGLKKRLEEVADTEHRSTNAQIEHILEMALRKHAEERAKEGFTK